MLVAKKKKNKKKRRPKCAYVRMRVCPKPVQRGALSRGGFVHIYTHICISQSFPTNTAGASLWTFHKSPT